LGESVIEPLPKLEVAMDRGHARIESVEARRLLSVTLNEGVLRVVGVDAVENIIDVSLNSTGQVVVTLNGDTSEYAASDVSRVAVHGRELNDTITVGEINARVLALGHAGNDTITSSGRRNVVDGGFGDDVLTGSATHDLITGGPGHDLITGLAGNDILRGGGGNDTVYGGEGNDKIAGNRGNDQLFGEAGADVIVGNWGDDLLDGGGGRDRLYGGRGNDTLLGGDDNDRLYGGAGADNLDGGGGSRNFLRDREYELVTETESDIEASTV
jgi:Ca2+-binding RTX toxin-like protein